MKANELMIGDWVRLQYNHFITEELVTKDFQVTEIRDGGETNYIWGKDGNMGMVEHIQPIPLTAEILEKNGFVVEPRYCYDEPLQYCEIVDGLWINISGENYFEGKLEYVHELQHALRLCGIDKQITI